MMAKIMHGSVSQRPMDELAFEYWLAVDDFDTDRSRSILQDMYRRVGRDYTETYLEQARQTRKLLGM